MYILQFTNLIIVSLCLSASCSKTSKSVPDPPGGGNEPPVRVPVVPVPDPPLAPTVGFFDKEWQPRQFVAPAYTDVTPPPTSAAATVQIDASQVIRRIPPTVWAHNANTWMTTMINESVFMQHIRALNPRFIRFPAGSGSDAYFWNSAPGQLPPDVPEKLVSSDGTLKDPGYWFGRTNQSWTASIDDYYVVLKETNSIGVLTVNYGYARYSTSEDPVAAAAHLAADWVRYDKGRTRYWEIGNETYGDWEWGYRIDPALNKDGQPEYVTGELYAKHVKVFADSMRKAAAETGHTIYIGASLYDLPAEPWRPETMRTWNEGVLKNLDAAADFYILHNYFTPYNDNSNASVVMNAGLTVPGTMMQYIKNEIATYGAPVLPIALTEWNMWAKDSKQQVSNTSGLFALSVMNETLKSGYGMAIRWDLLNGWDNGNDMGLFSAGDEPGIPKWTPRPAFHYMYYYSRLIGDRMVPANVTGNSNIKAWASTYSSGEANLTVMNLSDKPITIEVTARNFNFGKRCYYYQLEGGDDNGEFSRKVIVNGEGPTLEAGGPPNYAQIKARSYPIAGKLKVNVPARGATIMVIDNH